MSTTLLRDFYAAFARRDHAAMARCYAPDAHFSDPVFPDLKGSEVTAMWRMLAERATDLRIEASGINAEGDRGVAHWEAWYTFSGTGRPVHNVIDATFTFRNGLIARHIDRFDFHRWSTQALGPVGFLLGWTPMICNKVRRTAAAGLAKSIAAHGAP